MFAGLSFGTHVVCSAMFHKVQKALCKLATKHVLFRWSWSLISYSFLIKVSYSYSKYPDLQNIWISKDPDLGFVTFDFDWIY